MKARFLHNACDESVKLADQIPFKSSCRSLALRVSARVHSFLPRTLALHLSMSVGVVSRLLKKVSRAIVKK